MSVKCIPPHTPLYIVKLGFTGVYLPVFFIILIQNIVGQKVSKSVFYVELSSDWCVLVIHVNDFTSFKHCLIQVS